MTVTNHKMRSEFFTAAKSLHGKAMLGRGGVVWMWWDERTAGGGLEGGVKWSSIQEQGEIKSTSVFKSYLGML